jgi:hypothetical protein
MKKILEGKAEYCRNSWHLKTGPRESVTHGNMWFLLYSTPVVTFHEDHMSRFLLSFS